MHRNFRERGLRKRPVAIVNISRYGAKWRLSIFVAAMLCMRGCLQDCTFLGRRVYILVQLTFGNAEVKIINVV
jgi:hypothetical protein